MKKCTNVTLLCIGVLLLIFSQALLAQYPAQLKIYATDHSKLVADSLILGLGAVATNHIDSTLGEEEFPPAGPAFDVRFVTNPGPVGKDTCKNGIKINYHHLTRITAPDRWRIGFWSDDSGTTVKFTWQFLNAGANGWTIEDGSPDPYTLQPHFQPVDMTTATSFTYPLKSTQGGSGYQYIYINYFDGLKLTTASLESLTVDAQKKIMARKSYLTQFQFGVGPAGAPPATAVGLHLEFAAAVTSGPNSIFASAANPDGKKKIWNLRNPGGAITGPVTVTGLGDAGKSFKLSKWYWLGAVLDTNAEGKKAKAHTDNISSSFIYLLHEPNWVNVITEMYAQGFAGAILEKGKGVGMRIGVTDTVDLDKKFNPIQRYNVLPKPGDMVAALWKKNVGGQTGTPPKSFKYLLIGGKAAMVSEKKGAITPDKGNDVLYGEAIALNFNIHASDNYGKMENSGLGGLIYNKPGSPFNGWTISKFLDTLNHYMSWGSAGVTNDSTAFYAAAHDFNTAFSGPFDTVTFGSGTKTVVKGVRAVGMVSYLYRASLELPPVMPVASYHEQTPVNYKLEQNYPNPFNPTTKIRFELPQDAFVTLKIYNILGQEVTTLFNHDQLTQGTNEVNFDATRLASGVYYYRLVVNDGQFVQVKKMMLLK